MKRDGSEVLSSPKPPRAVHGRMSQLDTQPDPPALELASFSGRHRCCPDADPGTGTSSLAELPFPDDAPGSPVVDPPSPPSLTTFSYRGTPPPPPNWREVRMAKRFLKYFGKKKKSSMLLAGPDGMRSGKALSIWKEDVKT